MIITRKIQIYVSEEDVKQRKEFVHTLYEWRDLVRKAANTVVAHKFCQEQVKDFIYLKGDVKEKFYLKDILKEGKGMSEQNTTYRVLSDMLKGKVPADIYSCLNQAVSNTFKETKKDIYTGKASLRTYKNNIPIPFSAKAIANLNWDSEDKRFYFNLFGIPFAMNLGRDLSGNKLIVNRCLEGGYKICSSSIMIDDRKKKTYLLLCVDIPKKIVKLKEGKTMYAFLGVQNPIVCTTETTFPLNLETQKMFTIGTAEEFNYRRRQIQESLRRAQINAKYSKGGKGRKRKLQSLDRFSDKEKNYVETKAHIYSRELVNLAIKHECSIINLINQEPREKKAKEDNEKGNPYVLRNWSYYGLKTKIKYKAGMVGITLTQDKEVKEEIEYTED